MFLAVASMVCLGLLTFGVKADTDIEQLVRAVDDLQVEINGLKRRCSDAPPGGFIQEDGYILGFRIVAGKGYFGEMSWDMESNGDQPFVQSMRQCTCNTGAGPCNRNYRSSILDFWDAIPITTAKLSVYKNGEEKQFIIFNARDTYYWRWIFDESKVLESSWVDLKTETHDYFTPGEYFSGRSYFFNHVSGDCSTLGGWMFLQFGQDACSWAIPQNGSYPIILYSPAKTWVRYESEAEQADSLALWLKVDNVANLNAPCVQ